MPTTVAIQGIAGSFHHQAAQTLLDDVVDIVPCNSFADVFKQVAAGQVSYGVVAVENSLQGSINAVYRLLARHSAWVAGEAFLHIEQYLIAAGPGDDLADIRRVRSQAPALAQCELWLEHNLPEAILEETIDTAASVRDVVDHGDSSVAAIAGKTAAQLYKGRILAGPINDDEHNYTRFFLLTDDERMIAGADKTSIILRTNHAPGALQRALELFASNNVNLSKLDSHPIPGDEWHYAFYIDLEAGVDTPVVRNIFKGLQAQDCTVTVLGSYIGGELPL